MASRLASGSHTQAGKKIDRIERVRSAFLDSGKGQGCLVPRKRRGGPSAPSPALLIPKRASREAAPPSLVTLRRWCCAVVVARRAARPVERAARPQDAAGVIYRGLSARRVPRVRGRPGWPLADSLGRVDRARAVHWCCTARRSRASIALAPSARTIWVRPKAEGRSPWGDGRTAKPAGWDREGGPPPSAGVKPLFKRVKSRARVRLWKSTHKPLIYKHFRRGGVPR